jgi:hypothetical protein
LSCHLNSHYINHNLHPPQEFVWQRGYGVLSLGERQRNDAEAYVHNQKSHHEQQNTNSWLERFTDDEEGPPEGGLAGQASPGTVNEEKGVYSAQGEPPF